MGTTNKNLTTPANNTYIGTWDVPMDADLTIIDYALGGTATINVTGASGVVALTGPTVNGGTGALTAIGQYANLILVFTGTLTANVNYQLPTGVGGQWACYNNTTGAFTLTVSSAGGGSSVVLQQSYRTQIVCDGTNVAVSTNTPVSAAGSTTQIQVNSAGSLSGSAALTYSAGVLGVGTTGANGNLRLNGSTTGYTGFAAPTTAGNIIWTLPTGDGSNGSLLTTNGAGVLSWSTVSTGVLSFSAGTTGFTPSTASGGAITLGGTLATTNGGTGLTSFTSGGAVYATSTSALTTGTLPVSAGGTGTTSPGLVAGLNITVSGTWPNQTIAASGGTQVYPGAGVAVSNGAAWTTSYSTSGSGTVLALTTSPNFTTPNIGVASGTSVTLGVVSTSQGSIVLNNTSANNVTIRSSNSTSAGYTFTLPVNAGTNGYILSTDGAGTTSWINNTGGGGTVTSINVSGGTTGLTATGGPITGSGTITLAGTLAVANGGTGTTTSVGTGSVVLNTSPTLVTPLLGTPASGNLANCTFPQLNQNTSGSAGSVVNAVTFNNAGAGGVSGSTFNGSATLTVSYNTIGAPSTTGSGASGTWGISITGNANTSSSCSGNAATASTASATTAAVTFNNAGTGAASGTTFNGSTAQTISYNTVGAPSTGGAGASGTWGINITGSAGSATTASTANALTTSNNYQMNALGVGTSNSTAGSIVATGNITAYFSDDRLKDRINNIPEALNKVKLLNGFYFKPNDAAQLLGYDRQVTVGVSAQEVKAVLPYAVVPAPISDRYLAVQHEKLIPLLIEAIKELSDKVDALEGRKKRAS